ncbi:hypothetical protein [Kitasatospora sp. LaBMicrA B282]|uniref:hypothetical protein n=1 Tax=Kitasatospora sp. LaBMicrA B282 TaxID=3420949 RepID=UPI003D0B66CB
MTLPTDPFGDLFSRFFGMSPLCSPPAVQRAPIGRPVLLPVRTPARPAASGGE